MKFPTYPTYKESGVAWLGEVPEHWEVCPIKAIVSTPVTDGPHETPEIFDEGVPFVSAEAIKGGKINFDRIRGFISEEDHKRFSKKYQPQFGDLYMVKSGATTGRVAMVETNDEFNIWSPLAAIRCNPAKVEKKFLYFYLQSKEFQTGVELSWSFGTQQNIGMGVIQNLSVPLGTLDEQTAIADFLDRETGRIDTLVAKKHRLLELLKEKRTALISHTVTRGLPADVAREFGLEPHTRFKDSGIEWLGEIPEGWEVKRLKYLFRCFGGGTPSKANRAFWDGSIPWVSPKDMSNKIISDTEDHITNEAIIESATRLVSSGATLVVVRSGILRHTIPVATNLVPVTLNQDMKALVSKGIVTNAYIAYFIQGHNKSLLDVWSKSGCTVESIESEYMLNSSIPVPDIPEQTAIATYLDRETAKINRLAEKIETAITRLQEYRTALITAAVTGKIDFREVTG